MKRFKLDLSVGGTQVSFMIFLWYISLNTIKAHFRRYSCNMNLPMRIHFDEKDYTYLILTKGIAKETVEIQVSLDGKEYQLVRGSKGDWDVVDATVGDNSGLLKAIGRNIKLRYRL